MQRLKKKVLLGYFVFTKQDVIVCDWIRKSSHAIKKDQELNVLFLLKVFTKQDVVCHSHCYVLFTSGH
jgi:hypothetical protein